MAVAVAVAEAGTRSPSEPLGPVAGSHRAGELSPLMTLTRGEVSEASK